MIDDSIITSLSEDERKLLFNLYSKITMNLQKNISQTEEPKDQEQQLMEEIDDFAKHQYDILEQKMSKLDSPVELVFTINCTVYEKNPKGELINSNDIFIKNYHVPLENQDQIKEFIELFFKKFAKTTEQTCQEVIK